MEAVFGSDTQGINWWQMCLRAAMLFGYGLVLVRIAGKRAFGKLTGFDIVLGVVLGSILSRAITGNAPLLPAMAAAATIVVLHQLLARISFRWTAFGRFVKGRETRLVEDGRMRVEAMRKTSITEHELREEVRLRGNTEELGEIEAVYLERSGNLSVIKKR